MSRVVIHIVLCFLTVPCFGQVISTLSPSKDTLSLGEPLELYYSLKMPFSYAAPVLNFSNYDSLESVVPMTQDTSTQPYYAEVEWDEGFMNFSDRKLRVREEAFISSGQMKEYRDTFMLRIWDMGAYMLPYPSSDLDTIDEPLAIQSPMVLVLPPLDIQNPDTTSAILDIKPIYPEPESWKDYMSYYILALLILIISALLWYFMRRKNKEEETEETVVIRTADEVALEKLQKLRAKQLWQSGQIKEYQSELTRIIREYLENRYSIAALESTTAEIVRQLQSINLSGDRIDQLKQVLQIADLVKFAKANPPVDIHERFLNIAEEFVLSTRTIVLDSKIGEDE